MAAIEIETKTGAQAKVDALGTARIDPLVASTRRERRARRHNIRNAVPTVMSSPPTFSLASSNSTSTAGIPTGRTYHRHDSGKFTYAGASTVLATPGTILSGHTYIESAVVNSPGARPVWSASFVTDAPTFEIDYLGTAAPGFRIKVDGAYVPFTGMANATLTPAAATEWVPADTITEPSGSYKGTGSSHYLRVIFGTRKLRTIEIESKFMAFGGIYVAATDALYPTRQSLPRWMFFGDSVTQGSAALTSAVAYARICGERLGVDAVVSGAGGTGYLAAGSSVKLRDRLSTDVYPFTPDRIVIAAGINDGAFTPAQIQAEAILLYAAIATNLPGTPVTVLTNYSPSTPDSAKLLIRDAILVAAAASPNVDSTVDITSWMTGTGKVGATVGDGIADRFVSSDGTHPTQEGHEYLGRRLAESLVNLS